MNWELIPVTANTSVQDILKMGTAQLCLLGKSTSGKMAGEILLMNEIMKLGKYIGHPLDEDVIKEVAAVAYQECYWLSLAELKMFFLRVRGSKYEDNKNFAPLVFMGWLNDFCTEMHAERGAVLSYSWKQPKKEFILSPDKVGKNRETAFAMLKWITDHNDANFERLRKIAQQIEGQFSVERESEKDKKLRDKIMLMDNRIIAFYELELSNGVELDEEAKLIYDQAIARKNKMTNG